MPRTTKSPEIISLAGFWDDEDSFEERASKLSSARSSKASARVSAIPGMDGFQGIFEEEDPKAEARVSKSSVRASKSSVRSSKSARVSAIPGMEGFGGFFEYATPIRSSAYKPIEYTDFYTPSTSPSGYTPDLSRYSRISRRSKTPTTPDMMALFETPKAQKLKTPTTPEMMALFETPKAQKLKTPKNRTSNSLIPSSPVRNSVSEFEMSGEPLPDHPLYYWVGIDSEINKLLNYSIPLTTEAEAIARLTDFKETLGSKTQFKNQAKLKVNNTTMLNWAESMGYSKLKKLILDA